MNVLRCFLLLLVFMCGSSFVGEKQSFEESQKGFPKIKDVYERKEEFIKMKCRSLEIPEETFGNIVIRVFKMEAVMEVWVQRPDGKYVKFKQFDIYALSGLLGPKRQQGDMQVPEGFYTINEFNPQSNYYLSLGINYPNESDMKMSIAAKKGGDIFIHGAQCSTGCLAMSNYYIEDIYMCAVKAISNGQQKIPVQIFPFRMTPENMSYYLSFEPYKQYQEFWDNLAEGYKFFERNKRLPEVVTDKFGRYQFIDHSALQAEEEQDK